MKIQLGKYEDLPIYLEDMYEPKNVLQTIYDSLTKDELVVRTKIEYPKSKFFGLRLPKRVEYLAFKYDFMKEKVEKIFPHLVENVFNIKKNIEDNHQELMIHLLLSDIFNNLGKEFETKKHSLIIKTGYGTRYIRLDHEECRDFDSYSLEFFNDTLEKELVYSVKSKLTKFELNKVCSPYGNPNNLKIEVDVVCGDNVTSHSISDSLVEIVDIAHKFIQDKKSFIGSVGARIVKRAGEISGNVPEDNN